MVKCCGRWCPLFLISNFLRSASLPVPTLEPMSLAWPASSCVSTTASKAFNNFCSSYRTMKLWIHSQLWNIFFVIAPAQLYSFPNLRPIPRSFDRFLSQTKQRLKYLGKTKHLVSTNRMNEGQKEIEEEQYQVHNLKDLD